MENKVEMNEVVNENIVNAETIEAGINIPESDQKWRPDGKSMLVGGLGAAAAVPALAYGVIRIINAVTPEEKKMERELKRLDRKQNKLIKKNSRLIDRRTELEEALKLYEDDENNEEGNEE